MFTDLNRFVQKTSKPLNILYDHRDILSIFTMAVSEQVPVFRGMIDKESHHATSSTLRFLSLASALISLA